MASRAQDVLLGGSVEQVSHVPRLGGTSLLIASAPTSRADPTQEAAREFATRVRKAGKKLPTPPKPRRVGSK